VRIVPERPAQRPTSPWIPVAAVIAVALAVRLATLSIVNHPAFYFAKYPTLAWQFLQGEGPATRAFTASPLYLYFWYLLHVLMPGELGLAVVVQMVLGAVACGALVIVGQTFFDRRVGLWAGLSAALYLPFIANDATFVSEGLVLLLNSVALAFLGAAMRRGEAGPAAASGLLFGLSAAARPNILLVVPFCAAGLWFTSQFPVRRNALLAAAFILPVLAGPLLITWRNDRVSGAPVFVMSDSGIVFYLGNNELDNGLSYTWPRHIDLYTPLPGEVDPTHRIAHTMAEAETGRKLDANEAAAFWMEQGMSFIRQHPGEYLHLLLVKLRYIWGYTEAHDVQTTYEQERALRGWPLLRFGWIAPLSLLGLVVTAAQWRRLMPLYGILFCYTVTGLLFTVVARYRLPFVPVVLLLAVAGADWLLSQARAKRHHRLAAGVLAVVLLAIGINWHDPLTRILEADYEAAGAQVNRAVVLAHDGRDAEAEPLLLAIAAEPPTFAQGVSARRALADIAMRRGDQAAARRWQRSANGPLLPDQLPPDLPSSAAQLLDEARTHPDAVEPWLLLGAREWLDGNVAAAERRFALAGRLVPTFAPSHANRAWCLDALGQKAAARRWAEAARRLDPGLMTAHRLLTKLAAEDGRLDAVRAELLALNRAYPDQPGFVAGLAMVERADGELAAAARLEAALPPGFVDAAGEQP